MGRRVSCRRPTFEKEILMSASRSENPRPSSGAGSAPAIPARHAIREQDALWTEFLSLAGTVVDAMEKSVLAFCESRFELVEEVENEEEESDRREVRIEEECLRVLALYEPVASDLRRMAAILKGNRDWERIADLALRVARRARKLARRSCGVTMPESLKQLARDVLAQVRACYEALRARDPVAARAVIAGDDVIDRQYRTLRKEFRASLGQHADQIDAWLLLMNAARNLERIADHAAGIAQIVVYLQEGVIIRHAVDERAGD
jgi:phosphate transport system protein